MMIRNILRKCTREDCIFLACFIAMFGGIILYNANKQAEGFITVAHDHPERFVNGENVLIKRVHEEHWDIFYDFDYTCPDSLKTEENYRVLRENLEKGIRTWLAPLREITDRPIVDKFVFYTENEENEERNENVKHEVHVLFECEGGRSTANRYSRSIDMKTSEIDIVGATFTPSLPYRISTLLHELGHVFDLPDTYVGNPSFSPPSTGVNRGTIGRQPFSVMSIGAGCWVKGQKDICLDDKRAIQWLYRYHWEGLDPTNCPPEFEYEELTYEGKTVGGCVFKQPLIVELRQRHLHNASEVLISTKNLKINDQDEHGLTALHYVAPLHLDPGNKGNIRSFVRKVLDYPGGINVNITDNYGSTPLHWAAWFGNFTVVWDLLFLDEVDGIYPVRKEAKLNAQNNYGMTPLHYAAKLGREKCVQTLLYRSDIDLNIKDSRFGNTPLHEAAKNGHTEVVKMLLEHQDFKHETIEKLLEHQDINPNLRNAAGFTPLQLALQGGAVSDADGAESFQADYPEFWASLSEENRQHLSPRLSPAALQQAHAEIAALLRAYPGIILPDASDVNGDGVVNILDLVRVANAFGPRGQVPEDVNGDGVVNVQDLVWVAGAFGQ